LLRIYSEASSLEMVDKLIDAGLNLNWLNNKYK
jgi:hypothetical protein